MKMGWLKKHHDELRAANGGKLTQAIINADCRKRGVPVTRDMRRQETREEESEALLIEERL
jgi:hypothetical protein